MALQYFALTSYCIGTTAVPVHRALQQSSHNK